MTHGPVFIWSEVGSESGRKKCMANRVDLVVVIVTTIEDTGIHAINTAYV